MSDITLIVCFRPIAFVLLSTRRWSLRSSRRKNPKTVEHFQRHDLNFNKTNHDLNDCGISRFQQFVPCSLALGPAHATTAVERRRSRSAVT